MKLKILIVEDDPNMSLILKKVLYNISEVEIVGEAHNGNDAINLTIEREPDVIFMDIDLPEKDGIQTAKEILNIKPDVFLIYATGYSEYMPEAFELYAFDYLLKPYKLERIAQSVEKIRELMAIKERAISKQNSIASSGEISKKVGIKIEGVVVFLEKEKVIFISREKRKTVIHTIGGEKILTNESLDILEKRLISNNFFRCHRSYIINLDMLQEIQPWSRGNYLVIFTNKNKEIAYMTEDKYKVLQEKLNI